MYPAGGAPAAAREHPVSMSEARLVVAPIDSRETFKDKAYTALRNVIVSSDIYRSRTDIRLDERQLAQDFGISRTPVREAMAQLEREGFVRSVPRRGVYVVRKTKDEVIQMITGVGRAGKHGGAADHPERQRRRHRRPPAHVRDLRGRQAARQARRVFRGQHRLPPDDHRAQRQPRADPVWPRTCSPTCG